MLRPYQIESIQQIKNEFSKGNKKCLLFLATGSGKTTIFCEMVNSAERKRLKSLIVVRRRMLVENASQRLTRENVRHGVLMAGHWRKDYSAPVQVASIDTLIARQMKPDADLIIVDECHDATSDGYKKFLSQYPNAFIVACTATPWAREGLGHLADSIVHPITMTELIDQGYLVPFRFFAPSSPDMKGVKIQNGEYENKTTEIKMTSLTGDLISHYKSLAEGRSTLLFAVNINHSKMIAQSFSNAGIPSEHCDADTSDEDRVKIINRLVSGETKVVCNVGIFCVGNDIPSLGAIILARPTKSFNLFVQQCGRVTRPFPGKKDAIVLDHSSNCIRMGFPFEEPEIFLDGYKKEPKGLTPKVCENCFVIFTGSTCHACGKTPELKPRQTEIEVNDGVLKELKGLPHAVEISLFVKQCKEIAKRKNYKRGWAYFQVREKYGEETANKAFAGMQRSRESFAWFLRKNLSR